MSDYLSRLGRRYRLAVLTSHPIQYQVPLWRKLARHSQIDLTVYFCSDYGAKERIVPGFQIPLKWDIPLLDGYKYKFLRNYSPSPDLLRFWGLLNSGVIVELWKHKYDGLFVHAYSHATHLLAILMARLVGSAVFLRSESTLTMKSSATRRAMKQIVLPGLFKIANGCMAIGTLNRDYYEHYGAPKEKIFHMPYAVDNEWFSSQAKLYESRRDQTKAEMGIAASTRVILYAANFLRRKRPMDVIRAFEQLDLPDVALVMVGDGEEKARCQEYVNSRHIYDVHLVGFKNQTKLPLYYAIADVFVLPSQDEPWGLVINEAMCFGLPVIATDQVGAYRDLVHNGLNGFSYEAGNIPQLCDALRCVLSDNELRQKMRKASLDIVNTWGIAENVESLLIAIGKSWSS